MPKAIKAIQCRWCEELVSSKFIRRHLIEECKKSPRLMDGERFCSKCHAALPLDNFSKRIAKYRDGFNAYCKPCSKEGSKSWFEKYKSERKARKLAALNARPGRWVFKPCEFCGEMFRHDDMVRHRPRCEKRPKYTGKGGRPLYAEHLPDPSTLAEKETLTSEVHRLAVNKNSMLRRVYGITIEEFNAMLAKQEGRCAICGRAPDGIDQRTGRLHVDHDHTTNVVRELLCFTCNHGIGNFRDDPALLVRAIEYLARHSKIQMVS